MRILHTSDWHLGRPFHGEDLLAAQRVYVDHLIRTVEAYEVDLVVVSGDIYDRALPPVDAVALADDAFTRLARSRARVVITSGNHDSARRLGFSSRLVDAAGVHLRTDAGRLHVPVLLRDEHGPVAVYGIPFLEPDVVRHAWDLPARSHHAALGEAMRRIRDDLARQPPGTRSVVMAHAFVAGGQPSESERDIAVGGISLVPLELFDGIDYTALGHLHGRATLTASVRYSGSPLAYSFSEAGQVKGSWLVDLDSNGLAEVRFLAAPVARDLACIEGTLDELLTDPRLQAHESAWVQATLTDAVRPTRAMERLRTRFPHTLALRFAPEGGEEAPSRPATVGKSAHAIALDFVNHVRGAPATPDESDLLRTALECCSDDPDLVVERDTVVSR